MELTLTCGPNASGAGPAEVVERKGLGHPDTICDALAERLGLALSRFYLERFGQILHHNVDKALLWGGTARPSFGGGEVTAPIEIFLAGRAVDRIDDPDPLGVEIARAELLAENAVLRIGRVDALAQRRIQIRF